MVIYTDKFQEIYKRPEYTKPTEELIDFPLILDLELKHNRGEFMKPQTFYEVLKQSKGFGTKGINLGGMGDPMTHRNVINFIRNIRREKILSSLTTSGNLLYLAIDSICNSGLNTLNIEINIPKYRAIKSPLEILYKKRKFGPYIRVFQLCSPNTPEEFEEICDEFMTKPIIDSMKRWHKMTVAWDGIVFIDSNLIIGRIQDKNLYELWHSDGAQKTRKKQ